MSFRLFGHCLANRFFRAALGNGNYDSFFSTFCGAFKVCHDSPTVQKARGGLFITMVQRNRYLSHVYFSAGCNFYFKRTNRLYNPCYNDVIRGARPVFLYMDLDDEALFSNGSGDFVFSAVRVVTSHFFFCRYFAIRSHGLFRYRTVVGDVTSSLFRANECYGVPRFSAVARCAIPSLYGLLQRQRLSRVYAGEGHAFAGGHGAIQGTCSYRATVPGNHSFCPKGTLSGHGLFRLRVHLGWQFQWCFRASQGTSEFRVIAMARDVFVGFYRDFQCVRTRGLALMGDVYAGTFRSVEGLSPNSHDVSGYSCSGAPRDSQRQGPLRVSTI